jgi:hypothetical protein
MTTAADQALNEAREAHAGMNARTKAAGELARHYASVITRDLATALQAAHHDPATVNARTARLCRIAGSLDARLNEVETLVSAFGTAVSQAEADLGENRARQASHGPTLDI